MHCASEQMLAYTVIDSFIFDNVSGMQPLSLAASCALLSAAKHLRYVLMSL